jgi:glycine C-acetyltransferase
LEKLREKLYYSLLGSYRFDSPNIFAKCAQFAARYAVSNRGGILDCTHRVPLESGLDSHVRVLDPETNRHRDVLCFDSNGYLGFQHHPAVKREFLQAAEKFGLATPSVPLLGGTNSCVQRLERKIADFHGREDAMLFSSAYAANMSVIPALARNNDYILYDEAIHASTLQGVRLAKCKESVSFKSCSAEDLNYKIRELRTSSSQAGILVLAEGIYSMEGNVLPLADIRRVCAHYGAKLIVDECHSVGVIGPRGRGIEDELGITGACDLIVGCFSKALGFSGGYVTGPRDVILYLRYFASSYIFSTSLPAPQCAAIAKCFDLIDEEPRWLDRLRRNARLFRDKIAQLGFEVPRGNGAIFKIPINGNKLLLQIGSELFRRGLKCGVVTYPAVKDRQGLLRFVVTARHSVDDLDKAADILAATLSEFGLLLPCELPLALAE